MFSHGPWLSQARVARDVNSGRRWNARSTAYEVWTPTDNGNIYYNQWSLGALTSSQWRRQLWGTGARAPLDFQIREPTIQILCSQRDQLVQMSTTHSSFDQYSTALVTKLLVIEQLLHPALKSTVSVPWHNFNLCLSSQQILATPLRPVKTPRTVENRTNTRNPTTGVPGFKSVWKQERTPVWGIPYTH